MSITGTGNYGIGPDGVFVGDAEVTVTGDAGGFTDEVRFFNVGSDSYTGSLTLIGGGDGVAITVTDPNTPGFNGAIRIGSDGDGTLNVLQGARVRSINEGYYSLPDQFAAGGAYNINIGRQGGTGAVVVDGEGSFLGAYGLEPRITVGRDDGAMGTLTVSNGGDVSTVRMEVGRAGGQGEVTITGAGSTLVSSNENGLNSSFQGQDFSGFGPEILLGRDGGYGLMNISDGGSVSISNLEGQTDGAFFGLARDTESTGRLIVDGAGSSLTITQYGARGDEGPNGASLSIGRSGQGFVDIRNGGAVTITGDDAFVSVGTDSGDGGPTDRVNELNISSGGVLTLDSGTYAGGGINIANRAGNSGVMTVSGEGSAVNITSDAGDEVNFGPFLQVGRRGDGRLLVTDGGDITIDGNGDEFPFFAVGLGEEDGSLSSYGYALISGAGSTISVMGDNEDSLAASGFISIGRRANAEGVLLIEDGGVLMNDAENGSSEIAANADTTGTVTVTGDGSLFDAGELLAISADYVNANEDFDLTIGGLGRLNIADGGALVADEILIGERGTLSAAGTTLASDVESAGTVFVGGQGQADRTEITGVLQHVGGRIVIDAEASGGLEADLLHVGGNVTITDTEFLFDFSALSLDDIAIGDEFVFLTSDGAIKADVDGAARVTGFLGGAVDIVQRDLDGGGEALAAIVTKTGPTDTADTLEGSAGADVIDGLGGRDRISGFQGRDTMFGGDGDDVLRGGIDNDNLRGGNGNDVVRGQNGADRLFGNGGDDNLIGSIGQDTLKGGSGDDRLVGGGAADRLFGGVGNDTLNGLAGDDRLLGSAGDDVLTGGTGVDRFVFRRNAGDDTVLDFEDGREQMRIQNGAESFADLTIEQVGADAVISFTGSSITLRNFAIEDVDASDFLF